MTASTDVRISANPPSKSDKLSSFCRNIFVNRLFAPQAGQADLRVGGLRGSDSVSTRHPPLKPLPDPIPLKIQFPISRAVFQVSHDDPLRVLVNGAEVYQGGTNNGFATQRVPVALAAGSNEIVVQLTSFFNVNFNWAGFALREVAAPAPVR